MSPITRAPWRVAHGPFSLARAPHALLDGRRCRWRRASPTPAASAVAEPPVAAKRSQHRLATLFCAARCSLALRVASCMPAHPRSTVAVARQAQGAPSTADGPAQPRSVELPLNLRIPTHLAPKWSQWTRTTALNLKTTRPMPCAAVSFAGESRSRPPPRIAYKNEPELALEHAPSLHLPRTLPSHQEDLEDVSFPNSGRLAPPRPPA